MVMNHELRIKIDLELEDKLESCYNDFGKCLKKSEFLRTIFEIGLEEFKNKTNKGLMPNYLLEWKNNTPKLIN